MKQILYFKKEPNFYVFNQNLSIKWLKSHFFLTAWLDSSVGRAAD
nr:hypothetical protein [uncultured Campylobacter sp.]